MSKRAFRGIASLFLFLLLGGFFGIPEAEAADTCTCFCTSASGALEKGATLPADCQTMCADMDQQMISCAFTYAEYPSRQPRCFTQDACFEAISTSAANQQQGTGGIYAQGSFSLPEFQPPECPQGYGYCYPPERDYTLGIALGSTTTVSGFSDYISKFYTYLLSISVTIVIVMVMIGGLQYVLAGGSGNVQQAKERISNAVIGLLLLSCTYVILFTVNPNLVALQLPRLPLVKRIVLVGDDSCEDLMAKGFVLDEQNIQDAKGDTIPLAEAGCGASTVVLTDNQGGDVSDGTTCDFKGCREANKQCATTNPPVCLSCESVTSDSGVAASDLLCNSLTDPDSNQVNGNGDVEKVGQCVFSRDPGLIEGTGATIDALNPFGTGGVCASYVIDCTSARSCRDYDSVTATNDDESECFETMGRAFDGDFFNSIEVGGPKLETLCSADPCGLAPSGETCETVIVPNASWGYELDCVNSGFSKAYRENVQAIGQSWVGFGLTFVAEVLTLGFAGDETAIKSAYAKASSEGYSLDRDGNTMIFGFLENPSCELK